MATLDDVVAGLAPLQQVPQALVAQNQILQQIRSALATTSPSGGPGAPPPGQPLDPTAGAGGASGGGGEGSPSGGGGEGGGSGGGSGMASGLVSGMASAPGSGLVNRAYGAAVSKMPVLSVPNSIRNEYQSQMNKNAPYVSRFGMTNSEAFRARAGEEQARFRYMGRFSEEEARGVYKGALEQGYTYGDQGINGRSSQREVMDAAYEAKKIGVQPEEFMNMTAVASRGATQDMKGLVDTLGDLSTAVRQAGGDAKAARTQFMEAYSSGLGGGLNSGAAQEYAAAGSTANARLGPMFADSKPMERLTTDSGYQYMLGARMGMNPGDFQTEMNRNPIGVSEAASGMFVDQMGSYISGSSPEGWEWLKQMAADDSQSIELIAERFVSEGHMGAITQDALVHQAQSFAPESKGSFTDTQSVIRYLMKEMRGEGTSSVLAENQAKTGTMDMKGKSTNSQTAGLTGSSKSLGDVLGIKPYKAGGGYNPYGSASMGGDNDDVADASRAYYDQATKSGVRMGGIEQVLGSLDKDQENDQKVEVDGPDGKRRVVTMEQAVKYYPNQLQSGQARFVGGKYGGKDISAITGSIDPTAKEAGAEEAGTKHNTKSHGWVGESSEDYYKKHPEDAATKAGGARATIDLTDRAAKFFQITGYEEQDASGNPRDNNHGSGILSTLSGISPLGAAARKFGF